MDTQKPHLIVLDEERLLQISLEDFSSIFNFTFSFVKNLEEARQELLKKAPLAFLIVEKGDPSEQVRVLKKTKFDCATVFFVKTLADAASFQTLIKECKVDYILQQPIDKNEVAALLRKLVSAKEEKKDTEAYLTPELLEKYKEKIFEKIARIEDLIKKTESAADYKENLLELRNEIHKITGNAAPYGYPEAGKLCGAHEVFLYNIYSGVELKEMPEIVLQNELFLRKLKIAFQKLVPRTQRAAPLVGTAQEWVRRADDHQKESFLIHLVTSDFDLARYFQTAAEKKHIHLEIENDPESYLKNFHSLDKLPEMLIVDETFPFTNWNGVDFIKEVVLKQPKKTILYGLMTAWDDLDKRVEWLEHGIELIVKKPLTEASVNYVLLHAFKHKRASQAKVMIIDDDEEQGMLMKTILESINITTRYVQDASKLFKDLEEFVPDLLVLDILMPKYSGKLLLSTLREDVRFKNLVIVIATSLASNEIDEWAYKAKCDAIIRKPLNIPVFLARITGLLERQREYFAPQEVDSLTGLLRWDPFLQRLQVFLLQAPLGMKCAFVILSIAQWESLMGVLNINEAHQILLLFFELVKSHFFAAIFQGIYTENACSLFFKDLSGGEIEFLLESFYAKIHTKIWLSSQTQLKITANASVTLFGAQELELEAVIQNVKEGLSVAVKKGFNKTEIRRLGEQIGMPVLQKHVILVDDDIDLSEIVRFAFEKHGFSVTLFHNAHDALGYFAQLPELEKNALIILDRRLPDGDGIEILHKIQDKFPGRIKAIFLSSLSNEKEILEALRSGALDYITKPFSIEVLLEKASILLSK